MKIFVDDIESSSDYKDDSRWVEYELLNHLNGTLKIDF
jgi:hypothetical protein